MDWILKLYFLICLFSLVWCQDDMENITDNDLMLTRDDILQPPSFVNWPNGTVPFYINPDHFDNEQTLIIMTSLSLVAFKTCLRFSPAMVAPKEHEHVLTFLNPTGIRKCDIEIGGHSRTEPHVVILGYDCLKAPWTDRIVLRALGLPFEHNRQVRDSYIDVQYENIEQHAIPLYTKDIALPAALRALPYDINSVLHFGERDFSKNGHRTIIFKDRGTKQKWDGLSELDLRKIEIIYGPECRERDRQEKIELCHMYPGIPPVDRRKRSIETPKSLRVNPDITPPAETGLNMSSDVQGTLVKLKIEDEVTKIVEDVFRVSSKALSSTREKFCNITKDKDALRTSNTESKMDVLGIIGMVVEYAQSMVDAATEDLTSFCAHSDSVEKYQRQRCPQCGDRFYSTKNSRPFYSTKNKPYMPQSTKHYGGISKPPYDPFYLRTSNATETNDTVVVSQREKRQARFTKADSVAKLERRTGGRRDSIKWEEKHRSRYSPESERYADSEEGSKRGSKRPASDEIRDKDGDEYTSSKRNKKKRDGEGMRLTKRPYKGSQEKRLDSDSADTEKSEPNGDERENKKRKRPTRQDSEETKQKDSMEAEKKQDIEERDSKKKRKRPTNELEDKRPEETEEYDVPKDIERSPKTVELSKENVEFYAQRRWPHGVVRYVIDKNCTKFDVQDLRRRLAQINEILKRRTCVRVEEIRPGEVNKYEDYLVLDNSPDFVRGRVGGRQIFGVPELLAGGQHRQHTAMVVMSMLGFYFELSRHDRDEYVKVHPRHIRADKLHHFEKIGAEATFPLPYDYESATHPAWMFWRRVGKTGISTVATYKDKDPDGSIMKSFGQHKKLLSESDIIKINSVYGVKCMNINNPKSDWE